MKIISDQNYSGTVLIFVDNFKAGRGPAWDDGTLKASKVSYFLSVVGRLNRSGLSAGDIRSSYELRPP